VVSENRADTFFSKEYEPRNRNLKEEVQTQMIKSSYDVWLHDVSWIRSA
jgi:hypothetical protein